MSSAGRPGHCVCRESHPRQWAAQLQCRQPSREELIDGLDELISVGAGSPGATRPGTRPGQQSAPGIRAVAVAVAGGNAGQRDRSL
jgi:hypothetical protein